MKLTTRRTIRGWLLDAPGGTLYALGGAAVGLLLLGIAVGSDTVAVTGMLAVVSLVFIHGRVALDACPNCGSSVRVMDERYCSTCGTRLDDIEAAPPIDERVDERFRPVGLNEIERSPPVATIADGGEMGEADQDEVRG
jgi:DNA-directed RNA polymerase subunit RPC12/RpoP